MKTNFDTIDRTTIAEIFSANCTVCHEVRNSDECLTPNDLPCHRRMLKWLDADPNAMPELKVGDMLEFYYPESRTRYTSVYLGENIMWCNDGMYRKLPANKKLIVTVTRMEKSDTDDIVAEIIWSARND